MTLNITLITKDELSILLYEEAKKEGWFFSGYDIDFILNYAGNTLYAIKVNNHLAGCILWHTQQNTLSSLHVCSAGLFLVTNGYRGQKLVGPYLWEKTIAANTDNSMIICFNSVASAVGFYERLGFKKTGLVNIAWVANAHQINHKQLESAQPLLTQGIIKIITDDYDVTDYNKALFTKNGTGLCHFLQEWLKRPDAITLAYYEKGVVQGYGVATLCSEESQYWRISPLYACTIDIAQALLQGLMLYILKNNGQRIELSSLEGKSFALFLEQLGFMAIGKDYVVCNHAHLIDIKSPLLNHVFASIPLEYPHEIVSDMAIHRELSL